MRLKNPAALSNTARQGAPDAPLVVKMSLPCEPTGVDGSVPTV